MSSDSDSFSDEEEEEGPALVTLGEEEMEDSTMYIQSASSSQTDKEQKEEQKHNDKEQEGNEATVNVENTEELKTPESGATSGTATRYNSKQLVERKMDPTTIQHILTKRFRWDDGMRSYGPDTIYWLGEFGGFPAWPAWHLKGTECENRVSMSQENKHDEHFEFVEMTHTKRTLRHLPPDSSEAIPFIPLKVLQLYMVEEESRIHNVPKEQVEHLERGLQHFAFGQRLRKTTKNPSYGKMFELAFNYRSTVRSLEYKTEKVPKNQFQSKIQNYSNSLSKLWLDSLLYAEFIWYETEKRRLQGRGQLVKSLGDNNSRVIIEEDGVLQEYKIGIKELIHVSNGKSDTAANGSQGSDPATTGDDMPDSDRPIKRARTDTEMEK